LRDELVDAIVDVTETGSSLKANNLRIVDELLSSTPRLIANHSAWKDKWKRRKIENIALLKALAIWLFHKAATSLPTKSVSKGGRPFSGLDRDVNSVSS
jgi:ATP phosphoribosyltransferase